MELILVFLGAALVNNVVLSRSLGVTTLINESDQLKSSFAIGVAVTLIMTLSAPFVFIIHNFILYPLGITYLNIIVLVLAIVSFVQLLGILSKKILPALDKILGASIPLITLNGAVLGIILLGVEQFGHSLLFTFSHAIGAGVGFTLVMVLFASIKERIQHNQISANFKGLPIAMITAGLLALVFFGFTGL